MRIVNSQQSPKEKAMIVVTGATGKLGHHVIQGLVKKVTPSEIVAAVRNPAKAQDLAALGIQLREADYSKPETLEQAFEGAEKLLLISSNDLEQRMVQQKAVIDAAKKAGVKLLVYTSILRADVSTVGLAADHKATEAYIKASGIPYVFLRNSWYLENHTEALAPALQHGAILGAAAEGRFASASRADYAGAAVAVLTTEGRENKIFELAGDESYTVTELAAEVSKQAGKQVIYQDLPQADYAAALAGFGLPKAFAEVLADADAAAAKGQLDSSSDDLRRLLGRPTTTLKTAVASALKQ
jgi:NAD(P)H dehydrogenase (quinone)